MKISLNCAPGECVNEAALRQYAYHVDQKEQRLAEMDGVTVTVGSVSCSGCVVSEHGYGKMCGASIIDSQFTIDGMRPRDPEPKDMGELAWFQGAEFPNPSSQE